MSKTRRRQRSSEELPLGDAVYRLANVVASLHMLSSMGHSSERLETERDQLVEALNAISVTMGFECRIDLEGPTSTLMEDAETSDEPTALELIKQGAASSCCRITKAEPTSSRAPARKTTSRSRSRSK